MRSPVFLVAVVLFVAACSEPGVGPNDTLARAPTVQLTQLGGDPQSGDLCGGLSPCDAYDYRGDGSIGAPGMCFLPPTVDNHSSDPACAAPNTPGLGGIFQLAWCRVVYDEGVSQPPSIALKGDGTKDCQDPSGWQDLQEGDGHYTAAVRWRRNEAAVGDIFRVYVVRGEQMFAHRDLIIDPNLTAPADAYVHAIGYGNEPIKLVITEDFSCIKYDTQAFGTDNAATCLITGAESVSFETSRTITTFNFPDGNPTFLADFEVSECLSLGFDVNPAGVALGNALVDTPLADCKVSLSSEEIERLFVPGQIAVQVKDARWSDVPADDAPFQFARLNVLQYDEWGIGALPPSDPQGWFGEVTSNSAALRWLGWGLDKLAALVLPEPLYALRGTGWDFTRMSDFQVAVMPVMAPALPGGLCQSENEYCLDLGTFSGTSPVTSVAVKVSAPVDTMKTEYPANHIDVPDARLHFFPESGTTVSCPTGSLQGPDGRGCVPANTPDLSTTPPSIWPDHVVFVTGEDGLATVDWALGEGEKVLRVAACGIARPGPNEPDALGGDNVWGELDPDFCADREVAMYDGEAYDNGPADGFTPFEPVDTDNEVAIYGLPLEFVARTCPAINIDGIKDAGWEICAQQTVFTAPQKGPKVENNATLYTYSDGEALYIGVEVRTNDIGNRIFVNLTESVANGDGVEAAGDELLVIDQFLNGGPGVFSDWHLTQACVGNNASSLCGDRDLGDDNGADADGAATLGGAGAGTVFYEFKRPFGSTNAAAGPAKEDLAAGLGDEIGLRLQVTQGQGGGKGGFVYPDPQTGVTDFHVFTIE